MKNEMKRHHVGHPSKMEVERVGAVIRTMGPGVSGNCRDTFANKTDLEVWQAFKAGNEGAFNHIYYRYFPIMFHYATQFIDDKESVKDLLQDFFIDLRKKIRGLGEVQNIKAYLLKSIRRKVLEFKNSRGYKSFFTVGGHEEGKAREFEIIFSPEQQLINSQISEEKKKLLENALNMLTARQREVVYHYFYEGLDYQEIAEVMEISNVKSVRNLVYRSLHIMRQKAGDYGKLLLSIFL